MKQSSILTILFVFLSTVLMVSCDKERETLQDSVNNVNPPPVNNRNINLSLVNSTDQVFYFLSSITYPISCRSFYCTPRSRFIFRNDGSFVLQYNDGGNEYLSGIQYGGRYTQTLDNISFTWDGWSTAGPWGASGILRGDTLTVKYNTVMVITDFEDAIYLRK